MHRVNQKPKKILVLRFLAYGITLLLTIVTTVTLLYIALGYRFDRSGHVVQNGLLLVDNRPKAARILLNNQEKDNAAPGRFVLPAATYALLLERSGYRSWQKDVVIAPGAVRRVHYPVLLPEKLQGSHVATLESPYLISQSLDKKQLFSHRANAAAFDLTTLSGDTEPYETTQLAIPATIPREEGQIGAFSVIEWALNNKQLLLTQTLPSGNTNLISFDITKPEAAVNITALYKDQTPTDIHFVGGKTSVIYGLKEGILSRYNLEKEEITVILSDVRTYQPYGDTTVAYDRLKTDHIEIGIWQDDTATPVHTYPSSDPPAELRYLQYDGHFYLAITNAVQPEVIIYRDPAKKPVLRTQLPYVKLPMTEGARLLGSPSSQFLLARTESEVLVYDFEDIRQYRFEITAPRAAQTSVVWATDHHLAWQAEDGKNYLLEYDGANQQQLQRSIPGRPTFFTGNMEAVYDVVDEASQQRLQLTSLIVE